MGKSPAKRMWHGLAKRAPKSLFVAGRFLKGVFNRKTRRSWKTARMAKQFEKNGITLNIFDTLEFLERASLHNERAKQLYDALTKELSRSLDDFRPQNMRISNPSERVPLEKLLRETKLFLKSPESLRAYSRHKREVAQELASQFGPFGMAAALKQYQEAIAARLAARRKWKSKKLKNPSKK